MSKGRLAAGANHCVGRESAKVAEIFNLLYHRFAIGKGNPRPRALGAEDALQNGILRYDRLGEQVFGRCSEPLTVSLN
jgi:hypothetical protein